MLKPVLTEKTLRLAREGKYTFWVNLRATKHQVKKAVEDMFGVQVTGVRTLIKPGETKRGLRNRKRRILSRKKAIVTLSEKQKIDLFESSKK